MAMDLAGKLQKCETTFAVILDLRQKFANRHQPCGRGREEDLLRLEGAECSLEFAVPSQVVCRTGVVADRFGQSRVEESLSI